MIKPDTLWSFLKQSKDGSELTVGRVCRALAGHDVKPPLDPNERLVCDMIEEANEWHTESVMKEREKKRAAYERKKAASQLAQEKAVSPGFSREKMGEDGFSGEKTDSPSIRPSVRPSVRPSIHPSVQESVCNTAPAPAHVCVREDRRDVPTLKTVIASAVSVMNVTEGYARWWYAEMEARDWTCSDGMRVSTRNWRPLLKSWWNRSKPEEREDAERAMRKAEAAKPRTWTAADWGLCAERCAKCGGNGCAVGVRTPPDRNTPPYPPESCPKFTPVAAGNAAERRRTPQDAPERPSTRFEPSDNGITPPAISNAVYTTSCADLSERTRPDAAAGGKTGVDDPLNAARRG